MTVMMVVEIDNFVAVAIIRKKMTVGGLLVRAIETEEVCQTGFYFCTFLSYFQISNPNQCHSSNQPLSFVTATSLPCVAET